MTRTRVFPLSALCAALLSACGGSGGGDATTTVTGAVADGYLTGATVCLDINGNGRCDGSEPSATTTDNGAYELSGVKVGDEDKYPILVEVPATAVDMDSGTAVGKPYYLTSPAGRYGFVSPLTTLVQARIEAGSTADQAAADVMALVGIDNVNVSLYEDYVTMTGTADYDTLHEAAKVVAETMKNVYGEFAENSNRKGVHKVLAEVAADTLTFQKNAGSGFSADNGLGSADDLASLERRIAAAGDATDATQPVSIHFAVAAGTQSVACGSSITLNNTVTYGTTNTIPTAGQINDLRFYISNVALVDADGNHAYLTLDENGNQAYDVALLDFENAQGGCPTATGTADTYTTITGKVAPGDYVGLALTLGVPIKSPDGSVALNHSDKTSIESPAPLQYSSMGWNWQGGRKFTKIEFTPDGGSKWMVHLGSTGCQGINPSNGEVLFCTNPNRGDYVFDSFDPATQQVVLDLDELFRGSDVTHNEGGAMGCMSSTSDPECPAIFDALGINLATGMTLDNGSAQQLFSVQSLPE